MVQLETEVKGIIREVLFVNEEEVVSEAELVADLGADSLEIFELALQLEKEYEIEILDEEMECLLMVGDVIDCIRKRISGR